MDPLTAGMITGGANLLGSVFSSVTSAGNTQAQLQNQMAMQAESEKFNADQAMQNRQFQSDQAVAARDYQTAMSNTAYQRARADMEKAGLNPMMMFGSGSAASTPSSPSPSGSTASIGTPSAPTPQRTSPFAGIGQAVGSAVNTAVTAKTFDKLTEEVANLQAERGLIEARTGLTSQEKKTEESETLRRANVAAATGLALPGARFSAKQSEALLGLPDWAVKAATIGPYVGGSVGKTIEPILDLGSSALRARGLNILKDKMNQGRTSTETYTVRPGGWTKDVESWPFNP